MSELLIFCLLTSLKVTAIHVSCREGMIFFRPRVALGVLLYRMKLRILEKPLYDCLVCMSGFWGLVFWLIDGMNYHPVEVILIVAGINALFDQVIEEKPGLQ